MGANSFGVAYPKPRPFVVLARTQANWTHSLIVCVSDPDILAVVADLRAHDIISRAISNTVPVLGPLRLHTVYSLEITPTIEVGAVEAFLDASWKAISDARKDEE